jgi:hypothetical protein
MVNPEKKRIKAEMFPVVEEWQDSGLSKTAFCKQKGLAKSVFYYWQKRHKEDQSNGGFIPIKVNNGNRICSPSVIEITYPNGVIVRLPGQTLPAIVRQYLHL